MECPVCGNKQIRKLGKSEYSKNSIAYCRRCKHEIVVDIEEGKCFLGHGQ